MGTMAMSIVQNLEAVLVRHPSSAPNEVKLEKRGEQSGAGSLQGVAGTALESVLQGLCSWTDSAGVDWRDTCSSVVIPFPSCIDEEDIAKVAAYSAGVPELRCLIDMVSLENPQGAYPALVCLAAMIPRSHWRQQEVVKERLSLEFLTNYASQGHAQCRGPVLRLLLRLWGPELGPVNAAEFLVDSEECVRNEAALLLCNNYMTNKKAMCEVGAALVALDAGKGDRNTKGLFNVMQKSADPQVRDAMALLLASSSYNSSGCKFLARTGMIKALLWYKSDISEQVNGIILHAIAGVSNKPLCCLSLVDAGGVVYVEQVLKNMNMTGKYNDVIFENTTETALEVVLKMLQNIREHCNVQAQLRVEALVRKAFRSEQFHQNRRSNLIMKRFGPLLARLSA